MHMHDQEVTTEISKPKVQLSGEDGNVFAIIGRVSKALKRAGQYDQADKFRAEAMSSESYDAVLQLCMKCCDIS